MAVNFLDFTRSVRDEYADSVSDGVHEAFVIIAEIMKATGRPKESGGLLAGPGGMWKSVTGDNFQWRVLKDEMQAGAWGPGVGITPTTPQLLQNASLSMKGYNVSYFVDRWEEMSLGGETEYVDLIKLYEQESQQRWMSLFEQKFLADDSAANGWSGLPVFMTNSGTYATNIDLAATYATPKIFNYSGSGQTFDVTCLDRFREVCNGATHGNSQDGANAPSAAYCNRSDWQKFTSVIEDSFRSINVNENMLNRGFMNFTQNGVRVYWSDRMTQDLINRIYILNTHHLGIAHATPRLMTPDTAKSITGTAIGTVAVSLHKGQVFCGNTKKQGVILNTTSS